MINHTKEETSKKQYYKQHIVPNENGIPLLSFFTGAGFLDIGFMQAGFNVIWHNEFNPAFVKGFEYGMANLTNSKVNYKIDNTNSIVDIGPNEILKEAFQSKGKPEIFGIIGGPPCPDFSVGGKNRGREGDNGKLSQVYVNRIIELQPTFFVFENVPGLIKTQKHKIFFDHLLNQLNQDYLTDFRILNALDFGVPQDRERIFIVGFSKRWVKKQYGSAPQGNWFPWPKNEKYFNAKTRFSWPELSEFGSLPEKPVGIPDELMVGTYICNSDEIASLPNGKEGFRPTSDKFNFIPEGDVAKKSFKRLHRWRYSPTAAYGNNEVHLHPTEPRRLTVREALRIQTVPDTYILPDDMPLTHKFKTIGNGVPVKLANAVAESFAKFIRGDI